MFHIEDEEIKIFGFSRVTEGVNIVIHRFRQFNHFSQSFFVNKDRDGSKEILTSKKKIIK